MLKYLSKLKQKIYPLVLFIGCFFITHSASGDWNFFRGSPDMRGIAKNNLKLPLKLNWDVKIGRSVFATPVISGEKIFVGN